MTDILLQVDNLVKYYKPTGFRPRKIITPTLDGISFSLSEGENLGLIGESGSGKTTLGKCIVKLEKIDQGRIHLFGQAVTHLSERKFRPFRKKIQMLFQDLDAALNPGMSVQKMLEEILIRQAGSKKNDLKHPLHKLMFDVNLELNILTKYPSELSGGQKRRIAIAATLAIEPEIIIADELMTGLDNYTQNLVLQLLKARQKKHGLSIIFISHDLPFVKQHCQRIAVLYLGNIVEIGNTQEIINRQAHPYTHLLWHALNQTPQNSRVHNIQSGLHDYERPTNGCQFAPRCQRYLEMGKPDVCTAADSKPQLANIKKNHQVACHFRL